MKNLKFFFICFFTVFSSLLYANEEVAFTNKFVFVNFTDATLSIFDDSDRELFKTSVVLPKEEFTYPLPVMGKVVSATMGPTWVPTDNMHRESPGKYKAKYLPYEKGNAMGHCKVTIDFGGNPRMEHVRLHGNGKETDLGAKLSRGCIRIPDSACSSLVTLLKPSSNEKFDVFFSM